MYSELGLSQLLIKEREIELPRPTEEDKELERKKKLTLLERYTCMFLNIKIQAFHNNNILCRKMIFCWKMETICPKKIEAQRGFSISRSPDVTDFCGNIYNNINIMTLHCHHLFIIIIIYI